MVDKKGNITCNTIDGNPAGKLANSLAIAKNAFKTETFSFETGSGEPKIVSNFTVTAEWEENDNLEFSS